MIALDNFCRRHHVKLSKDPSIRMLELANIIIHRYRGVILVDRGIKYLCNNPKHLKRFTMHEYFKHNSAIITPYCNKLAKYGSL